MVFGKKSLHPDGQSPTGRGLGEFGRPLNLRKVEEIEKVNEIGKIGEIGKARKIEKIRETGKIGEMRKIGKKGVFSGPFFLSS